MNFFSTASQAAFGYVRFVTGSFIFISGYIIVIFYEKRLIADRWKTSLRLLIRGFKLLLIFTFLNVSMWLTGISNPAKTTIGTNNIITSAKFIYIFNTPRIAAFQVLLPIAYLILLAPFIMMLSRFIRNIALILLTIASYLLSADSANVTTDLITIGFVGMMCGMNIDTSRLLNSIKNIYLFITASAAAILSMNYLSKNSITYIAP